MKRPRGGASALFWPRLCAWGGGGGSLAHSQTITSVTARQRWPWNNLVDIDYTVEGSDSPEGLYIRFEIIDGAETNAAAAITPEPPLTNGTHRVTWDPGADGVRLLLSEGAMCRAVLRRDDTERYMVIDLSKGTAASASDKYPVSYLTAPPAGGWGDEYKTDKLVMRRVDPGTFMMGSPSQPAELGRSADKEDYHQVTLTNAFYIGVFEVTQAQWKRVMGNKPAASFPGERRPMGNVSYEDVRGKKADGYDWPKDRGVAPASFAGMLNEKTSLNGFDLPTEAQWEYACRAGTTTALNSGKNLSNTASCPEMDEVGRYKGNTTDGRGGYTNAHTTVGSYLPNAWGLYDMHGNVYEWCRDWYTARLGTDAVTEPEGPDKSGVNHDARVRRGGGWNDGASFSRSAFRYDCAPGANIGSIIGMGFRIFCPAGK